MNAKMKAVLIGAFGHFGNPLKEIAEGDTARLAACAPAYPGEDMKRVAKIAESAGADLYEDYRAMLAREMPDIAIVSTRMDRIAPTAIDAASAGCHLICEKPLAIDCDSLEALYRTVKKNNVQLIGMLSMRSHAAFHAAREVYRSGKLGELAVANARKSYGWGTRPDWFGERAAYGGTIPWIGIHALDMIHFITGLRFKRVAAMHANLGHPDRPQCEDACALSLELANGALASISVDYFRPETAPSHGDDWARIVGSKGVLEANATRRACETIIRGEEPATLPLGGEVKIYASFLSALAEHKTCGDIQAPGDAFMLTYACLKAREAADTGRVLEIEDRDWD
ncbi:MAG: putative oxidoreductase YcjS [candidate division BRC1 bacterium ADurb.BinA364]|nr:MAG: putative oxidoreductase YcjS [candidate division BRC1 bacterium ADurb.BinA364]